MFNKINDLATIDIRRGICYTIILMKNYYQKEEIL